MTLVSNLVLPPLSLLYRAVTQVRATAYEKGLFHISRLDAPVISVGNLTVGGTGKTPFVEWLCRLLADQGKRVCVLTRGYGRDNPGARVLVSDGSTIRVTAAEAGDEPLLLAQNLKGLAAVISDADRASGGKWAVETLGTEVFVLDDGFQHLQLARDLNILLIDVANPWGGGHVLPYGRLREPRSGLSRADCIVLTRVEQDHDLESLKKEIRRFNETSPIFNSTMKVTSVSRLGSNEQEDLSKAAQPVAAFCGLANPQSFFDQLRDAGFQSVLNKAFSDHHWYVQAEIDSLCKKTKESGACSLITTAKDAVKLQTLNFDLPCYVLHIEISMHDETGLRQLINSAIR